MFNQRGEYEINFGICVANILPSENLRADDAKEVPVKHCF